MTTIVTVLRSGGDYKPEHVQELHSQFGNHEAVCLSDVDVPGVDTIKLAYPFKKWFAKMELFRPDIINDDIFYVDLDTWIIKNLDNYLVDTELRMLSDFYHPDKPASGIMYIPNEIRATVWNEFISKPDYYIANHRGDQDIIQTILGTDMARYGSAVKSYKVHVAKEGMSGYHNTRSIGNGLIPEDTDILCFHGANARPWMTGLVRPEVI